MIYQEIESTADTCKYVGQIYLRLSLNTTDLSKS